MDTWWQTETGGIMISPLPGVTATKPGSAMTPLPGISAIIVNDEGHPVGNGEGGYLVIDKPWPAMLRTIFGDDDRYKDTYWSRFAAQGYYFAGDGAKYDTDGALWLLGRVDDVMNISGHRISTTEVESALVSHPAVAEAAVVGAADEMTGQGIVAFVILRDTARRHRRRPDRRTPQPRRQRDRAHRQTQTHPRRPRTPQNPIRQNHAPTPPRHRRKPPVGDVTTLQDSAVMTLISSGLDRRATRRTKDPDLRAGPPPEADRQVGTYRPCPSQRPAPDMIDLCGRIRGRQLAETQELPAR